MNRVNEDDDDPLLSSRWSRCGQLAKNCRKPFQTKYYSRPDKSQSIAVRLQYSLLCPLHGKLGRCFSFVFCIFLLWVVALSVSPLDALPGTNVFSIILLLTASIVAGKLVSVIKLPPMIGMFLVGVILRNAPHIDAAQHILPHWSASIRQFSLAVLLLQTGLKMNSIFCSFSSIFYRLHLLPFVAEFVACTLMYHFIIEVPWSWSLSLGQNARKKAFSCWQWG